MNVKKYKGDGKMKNPISEMLVNDIGNKLREDYDIEPCTDNSKVDLGEIVARVDKSLSSYEKMLDINIYNNIVHTVIEEYLTENNIETLKNQVSMTINIDVIKQKELINNKGKKFYIVEIEPEIIFIIDENNNLVNHYCGSIDEDEDNLKVINNC